jgi:Holliday junction resolvase RusA-like endonuclease
MPLPIGEITPTVVASKIEKKCVYVLMGDPVPLARPRFSSSHRVYDCQKEIKSCHMVDLEKQHGEMTENPKGDLLFKNKPLALEIVCYLRIPRTSKKREDFLKGTPHFFRPDLSNMVKYIEDISKGIIISDDCLISTLIAHKEYSTEPRVEFSYEYINTKQALTDVEFKRGIQAKYRWSSLY